MPKFDEVKDSGKRQEFKTGSVRDTNIGKGRYDLISPLMLQRLAKHFENGATKYGDRNWEKGQPLSRYFDSAVRHLYKHLEGMRDEDHLAAAVWNVGAMIHTEELIERGLLPEGLNDLPNYLKKEETQQEKIIRLAFGKPEEDPRPFIEKGQCNINHPTFVNTTCDLGYACDCCPYNKGEKDEKND